MANVAGWYPDPNGKHEFRYWDGAEWTASVSNQGVVSQDPLAGDAANNLSPIPSNASPSQTVNGSTSGGITALVIALLFCCSPLGIVLMWVLTKWSAKVKWIITGIWAVLIAGVIVITAIGSETQNSNTSGSSDTNKSSSSTEVSLKAAALGDKLKDQSGVTVQIFSFGSATASQYASIPPGSSLVAIDVEGCVPTNGKPTSFNPLDFSLAMTDHTKADAGLGDIDNQISSDNVSPGDCLRGPVAFEVPAGKQPAAVLFQPVLDTQVLRWSVITTTTTTSSTTTTTAPPTTVPVTQAAPTTSATEAPVQPGAGATALCNDGTYSYAAHHQGACSHHGGVSVFYK